MNFNDNTINYWFTGDTHFGHKNITKGVSRWSDTSGCRDFDTVDEMSTHIVDNINKLVMPDDVLFHVGDWSFGGIQNIWNFRKRVNCENIYLCLGNHDHHIKKDKKLPNAFVHFIEISDFDFTVQYVDEKGKFDTDAYAQEIFNDVQPMYEIKVFGQRITLCHYSMRTWFFHNKGSYMIFGHSHGSLHPEGKTIDVGVDNAYNVLGEYRPFKFQELQKLLNKRPISKPDHHNEKTNA